METVPDTLSLPWGSLWWRTRERGQAEDFLSEGPAPFPPEWVTRVNEPESKETLVRLRQSVRRGQPFGEASWTARIVEEFSLHSTVRPRGRPRKIVHENGS